VVCIRFASETEAAVYRLGISPEYPGGYLWQHVSGTKASFKKQGKEAEPLEVYLQRDPVIIRYADGTHSYNCFHIPTKLEAGIFPKEQIDAWSFDGIPLNAESMGKEANTATVQHHVYLRLQDEFDLVFNDDGSGEAADLVCLKNVDDGTIRLTLVHCKGAYAGHISGDIRNFYILCGQAQKCISVKHAGLDRLATNLRRREALWVDDGATRFLKGGPKQLSFFKEKSRKSKLEFEVVLVQPGVTSATLSDDMLRLLATTELFLKKTTEAAFRVIINSKLSSQDAHK